MGIMLEKNEYSKNWESHFYLFSLELCYMQLGPCSQSQLTQIHPGQQWKAILGKRIPFLSKHGGGMRDSSQQTKRKITTTTAITTPPPPLQLLLLILGREDAIVNLNLLPGYILVIGWVRVCPGMYSSLKCVKA